MFRMLHIIVLIVLFNPSCMSQTQKTMNYEEKRAAMVRNQIKSRGIRDEKVLNAMLKVERHRFVPSSYRSEAYEDYPLPIGEGQTISQPYIVAFMTEALRLKPEDRMLEVGTGSGYQAAVLAEICDSVFTIEIFPSLASSASQVLTELGYDNIFIKTGDGYLGWEEHAPFDCIMVTCSPTHIPKPLEEQLAEGGRMIIPVGAVYTQELYLFEKKKGKLTQKSILPVRFVPMIDEKGRKY